MKKYVVPPLGGRSAKVRQRYRLKAELHTFSAGFTLIELLVTLAIVAVVVSITVPTIESLGEPKYALRKEGRRVMKLMAQARTAAMSRKRRVDIWVDPQAREIRMIESRSVLAPGASDRTLSFDEPTNSYERIVAFDDDVELVALAVDEIEGGTAVQDIFQPVSEARAPFAEEPEETRAVSFTHLGGSTGGGIGLEMDGVRLAIAPDVLTGRPRIVKRSVKP